MDSAIAEWLETARRVERMLAKIKALRRTGGAVPPDVVAELGMLEDAVQARLRGEHHARPLPHHVH